MSTRATLLLLCAALGQAGCGVAHHSEIDDYMGAFQHAGPFAAVASRPNVYVRLPKADAPALGIIRLSLATSDPVLHLHNRGTSALAIHEAWLASSKASPCSGQGARAKSFYLDGQRRWNRPLSASSGSELNLEFPPAEDVLRVDSVVDLSVEGSDGRRCARMPLGNDRGPSFVREGAWTGGGAIGFRLANDPEVKQTRFGVTLGGSVGRFVGPVRFGARLDLCINCSAGEAFLTVPATATADWLVTSGRYGTLGLHVGYQGLRYVNSFRYAFVHGPRLGIHLLGRRPFAGAPHGEAFSTSGVSLFALRQFDGRPAADDGLKLSAVPSWSVGVEWLGL